MDVDASVADSSVAGQASVPQVSPAVPVENSSSHVESVLVVQTVSETAPSASSAPAAVGAVPAAAAAAPPVLPPKTFSNGWIVFPSELCTFFLKNTCLRMGCCYFHGNKAAWETHMAKGASMYRITDGAVYYGKGDGTVAIDSKTGFGLTKPGVAPQPQSIVKKPATAGAVAVTGVNKPATGSPASPERENMKTLTIVMPSRPADPSPTPEPAATASPDDPALPAAAAAPQLETSAILQVVQRSIVVCLSYLKGRCTRQQAGCRFVHLRDDVRPLPTHVCAYNKGGPTECQKGPLCRYYHGPSSELAAMKAKGVLMFNPMTNEPYETLPANLHVEQPEPEYARVVVGMPSAQPHYHQPHQHVQQHQFFHHQQQHHQQQQHYQQHHQGYRALPQPSGPLHLPAGPPPPVYPLPPMYGRQQQQQHDGYHYHQQPPPSHTYSNPMPWGGPPAMGQPGVFQQQQQHAAISNPYSGDHPLPGPFATTRYFTGMPVAAAEQHVPHVAARTAGPAVDFSRSLHQQQAPMQFVLTSASPSGGGGGGGPASASSVAYSSLMQGNFFLHAA